MHHYLNTIFSCLAILLTISCQNQTSNQEAQKSDTSDQETSTKINDPHSYAKPSEAAINHLDLEVDVDFDDQQIAGTASYKINNKEDVDSIYLDAHDLTIDSVTLGKDGEEATGYSLGKDRKHMGQPLAIAIKPETQWINIQYKTSPNAGALQWVKPHQTAGGDHPFLYTQSQAILARTWIPIQDGPGMRFTYEAQVRVPENLLALMSAGNPQEKNDTGVYHFKMEQPIPAYLMAMAVGDIDFKSVSERTGVYAEPSVTADAAYEFANMDSMLTASKALYGKYKWDRYDIIILPPSFPFGGMENPRLSFITPTIIAGDRSLTSLIAHEMAHSWSGNLVTNATWNDFWINEGFTVYFERRIMEKLYGKPYANMLAQLGYQDLKKEVASLGKENPATKLKLDLKGENPDDAVTYIPYEKGYSLLRMIENKVGREQFDQFINNYFDEYAFKTISTEGFLNYYRENLIDGDTALAKEINIEEWVYEPGIPDNAPKIESERFAVVEQMLDQWKNGSKPSELKTNNWTTHEWLHFLRHLPDSMSQQQMANLDNEFAFTNSNNSEIQAAWYEHAINNHYEKAYDSIEQFLVKVGRRKFLTPLYTAMMESNLKDMAIQIYQEARPGYHTISRNTIDEVVNWEQEEA